MPVDRVEGLLYLHRRRSVSSPLDETTQK
jgi:hypothetical protein